MSQGPDVAARAVLGALRKAAASTAAAMSLAGCRWAVVSRDIGNLLSPWRDSYASADEEVLVRAGRVLARPLIELLAEVAARAEDVQAQAAVLVLELERAVRLRN